MSVMDLCDPRTIKSIMNTFGLAFRKEFGQNFLINKSVVENIAEECCENEHSTILEIGPGIGSLTRELAQRYDTVIALEIDKGLIPVLSYTLDEFRNCKVINADVMKADLAEILKPYFEKGPVSVCANLPYYITTPILMKLLESNLPFEYITIMIQSEVADRLCARAGSKDCGAITSVLSYYGQAERLFEVTADNYLPAPKVDSSVVRVHLYQKKPCSPKDEKTLFRTIKAAFEQRRKTLPNALSAVFQELTKEQCTDAVLKSGFSADIRGEKLDIYQFSVLSDHLYEMICGL